MLPESLMFHVVPHHSKNGQYFAKQIAVISVVRIMKCGNFPSGSDLMEPLGAQCGFR